MLGSHAAQNCQPKGCVVWFTGLSGAGKTTLSLHLAERLREHGTSVELLDGDLMRRELCRDLGFSQADRDENVRRIGYVARLLSQHGVICLVAAISPYRAAREAVRASCSDFVEVYVACPLEELIRRDVKSLYKKALAGEIKHFTGISDPYEVPLAPELVVDTSREPARASADRIWDFLLLHGFIRKPHALPAKHENGPWSGQHA